MATFDKMEKRREIYFYPREYCRDFGRSVFLSAIYDVGDAEKATLSYVTRFQDDDFIKAQLALFDEWSPFRSGPSMPTPRGAGF